MIIWSLAFFFQYILIIGCLFVCLFVCFSLRVCARVRARERARVMSLNRFIKYIRLTRIVIMTLTGKKCRDVSISNPLYGNLGESFITVWLIRY